MDLLLNLISLEVERYGSTVETVVVVGSARGRGGPVIEGRGSVATVRRRGAVAPGWIPTEGGRPGADLELVSSKLWLLLMLLVLLM